MTLSKKQLLALAREARELAYDICEGREPQLEAWNWCNCGAGTVAGRAGFTGEDRGQVAYELDCMLKPPYTLSRATSEQVEDGVDGALVFPLLALADELENAAEPQKDLR